MTFSEDTFIKHCLQPKLIHFDELALALYKHQLANNKILQKYVAAISASTNPKQLSDVAFLPVSFFKTHQVTSGSFTPQAIYTSSTTTGQTPAKHYVANNSIYEQSYQTAFSLHYGNPNNYVFLCLLPNYLERKGSSLIAMMQGLITLSGQAQQGFYLNNFEALNTALKQGLSNGKKVFLLGVTYALIDFAKQYPQDLSNCIIMETGGMKGRKQEQTRYEVHQYLKQQFNTTQIHSEYGMTELLSQAYATKDGLYTSPPWMRIYITDINDPFSLLPIGKSGIINVIDLANISSCGFIKTQDIGKLNHDGTFEVLGRADYSEARGCSLMYV